MAKKLPYDVTEVRLRIPKHMADKLSVMADSYGVSRQAIIQMILGQSLSGTEKMAQNVTEALARAIKESGFKETEVDAEKAINFLKQFSKD